MLDTFEGIFTQVLLRHAPYKKKFRRICPKVLNTDKPWITESLATLIKHKHELHKSFKDNPTQENRKLYNVCRNRVNRELKTAHELYTRQNFSNINDPKKQWSFVNKIRGKNKHNTDIDEIKNSFGESIRDPNKIANLLNVKFSALGNYTGDHRPYENVETSTSRRCFNFAYVTEQQCIKVLLSLNPKKPLGPTAIPGWALRDSHKVIATHICFIFNQFLNEETFPVSAKLADVTPIFKKGDPSIAENYRPISITSAMAKVFEKLLLIQVNEFLHKEKLQTPYQFGYRKGYSTQDALLYATETWRKCADNKRNVHVAFLDLSKAFNSLNHQILNSKLEALGFGPQSRNILMNFTTRRMQRVNVNGTHSDWLELNRGVPQGTVLGPLLFSLYVNDICSTLPPTCKIIQYADDTCLFVSCATDLESKEILETALGKLTMYFQSHELSLNLSKTEYLVVRGKTQSSEPHSLKSNNTVIENKSSCKYLGVYLDQHLSYTDQINKILANMAVGIKSILQIRNLVPLKARLQLLKSIVLSHLHYSVHLLSGLTSANLMRLNRQINWALRCCYFGAAKERITQYRLRSGILPAEYQIKYALSFKTWCIINNRANAFKDLPFPNLSYIINTRTQNYALENPGKSRIMQNSFLTKGIQQLNTIPHKIRCEQSTKTFKRKAWAQFTKCYAEQPNNRILTGWENFHILQ